MKITKVSDIDLEKYKAQKRVYRCFKNKQRISYDYVLLGTDQDLD